MTQASIKVGMIAEETGALSFMGRANANVARMVVDEINANGGLLGRKIELYLEDGATTDAVAEVPQFGHLRRLRIFGQQDKLRAERSKGRETWA